YRVAVDSGTYSAAGRTLGFDGIENVIGGAAADSFKIITGSWLTGSIDGRSSNDLLDYSAYRPDLVVNLEATLADCINAGVSSIENVTGGRGSNHLIGDDQNNRLTGGPGYNILEGRGGDDILVTTGGYNVLIGGDGHDKAVIAYRSKYEAPFNDIEEWQFLRPAYRIYWSTFYYFDQWPMPPRYTFSQSINSATGGSINFRDVIVVIPPGALINNAEITINKLTLYEQSFLVDYLQLGKIISEMYQIIADQSAYLMDGQYVIVKIAYDPNRLFDGEEAVLCQYDPLNDVWVELPTRIEYDPETGQYYAVTEINILSGIFAVFRQGQDQEPVGSGLEL
ncbi:MAG: hypothetical protein R6U08_08720, partial [Bacillota bacterium]